jgi:hypothetical protein
MDVGHTGLGIFWSRIVCPTHDAIARFRFVSFEREEAMPTIGLLTQTTTGADANVWDGYIQDFTDALCTNGYTTPIPAQTGVDYDSYFAGAQALMQGRPVANVPPADVIVTAGTVAAQACYDATQGSETAVVVASAGDLNLKGLIVGANLTGCTNERAV